jgi:hypothetical protein
LSRSPHGLRLTTLARNSNSNSIAGSLQFHINSLSLLKDVITSEHFELIGSFHNADIGHFGIAATVAKLHAAGHQWAGMHSDVADYIRECITCSKIKSHVVDRNRVLKTIAEWEIFHSVSMDSLVLNEDRNGYKYVIAIVCNFSRMVELYPAKDLSAESGVAALLNVAWRYGVPAEIRTDGGSEFDNTKFEEILRLLKAVHKLTIAYKSSSNGLAERINREIISHIKAIYMDFGSDSNWSDFILLVQRMINSCYHRAIGTSPSTLLFGGQVNLERFITPNALNNNNNATSDVTLTEYIQNLQKKAKLIYDNAVKYQTKYLEDRRIGQGEATFYPTGQLVLIAYPHDLRKKTDPTFFGPAEVVDQSDNLVTVRNLVTNALKTYDISRLKVFHKPSSWTRADVIAEAARDVGKSILMKILKHTGDVSRLNEMKFLCQWAGDSVATWESYQTIMKTVTLVEYLRNYKNNA